MMSNLSKTLKILGKGLSTLISVASLILGLGVMLEAGFDFIWKGGEEENEL